MKGIKPKMIAAVALVCCFVLAAGGWMVYAIFLEERLQPTKEAPPANLANKEEPPSEVKGTPEDKRTTEGKGTPEVKESKKQAELKAGKEDEPVIPSDNPLTKGIITKIDDAFDGRIEVQGMWGQLVLRLDKNTRIIHANGKKATTSDLMTGQRVNLNFDSLEQSNPSKARAKYIVIDAPDDGIPLPFKVLHNLKNRHIRFPLGSLTVSRNGKLIAAAGSTYQLGIQPVQTVIVVDAESSKVLRELPCGTNLINKLVFSRDSKLLFAGGQPSPQEYHFVALKNNPLFVWDLTTGKSVKEMTTSLWDPSPDGKHLVVVDNFVDEDPGGQIGHVEMPPTFTLQVFDTANWKEVARIHEKNAVITTVRFSPDSKMLAMSVPPYSIRLWDWQASKDTRRIEVPKLDEATTKMRGQGQVPYLEFSPDGSILATLTDLMPVYYPTPRKIDLWNVSTGKLVRSLEVGPHRPMFLSFTPKGDKIAISTVWENFRLLDVASGKSSNELPNNQPFLARTLYHHGLTPEQSPQALPIFRDLWIQATGGKISWDR
jgi:WD40 repeat protein